MSEEERAASVLERQLLVLRANQVQFLDLPGEWSFSGGVNDVLVYVDNSFVRYPSLQHVKSLFTCHQQVIPLLVGTVNVQQPLWAYVLWRRDGTFCITLYDFVVGVLNAPSTVFFLEALRHKIVYLDAYDWKHMALMIMMEYAYRFNMSELKSAQCEPKVVVSIDVAQIHSVCKPRRVDLDQIQFMELEDSLQTVTLKETRPVDLQNYYVSTQNVQDQCNAQDQFNLDDDDFFPSALFTPLTDQSTMISAPLGSGSGLPPFDFAIPQTTVSDLPPFDLEHAQAVLDNSILEKSIPSGLPPLPSFTPQPPPQQEQAPQIQSRSRQEEYPLILDKYGREVVQMGSEPLEKHLLSTESNAELEQALFDMLPKVRPIRRLDRRLERPAYYRLRKEGTYFKTVQVVD